MQLFRDIEAKIDAFFQREPHKALLITGARQIGKTYSIRHCIAKRFPSVVEINFLENSQAKDLFRDFHSAADILRRLSALYGEMLLPGKTVIFLDEIQECAEFVTAIKFLVEEGSYRYILSGSLLGVALKNIRSVPVGYLDIMDMYPLNIREFCLANKVSASVLSYLQQCFEERSAVDPVIHAQMLELLRLYLIVGGMPAAVSRYLDTNNLQEVQVTQESILRLYRQDIAKYDPNNKLYLDEIFNLIPSELNQQNKRFILKQLNENFKFSRYVNSFLWLKEAGVALPVYHLTEPLLPLLLQKSDNLFKLFLADVGLLAAMYADGIQIKLLSDKLNINYGAIYENLTAQELKGHGYDLYYYNSHKHGELDFVIARRGEVLPLEIKSGKVYQRHRALSNLMDDPRYALRQAMVFCNENVCEEGKITYYPIYMLMFLEKEDADAMPPIYQPDLSALR